MVLLTMPLEPDGKGCHWFSVNETLQPWLHARAGDPKMVTLEPMKIWPEPSVPADLRNAFNTDSKAHALWERITPMARRGQIRWMRATNNAEIRKRRVAAGISKLVSGERRPCCWNRNLRTDPTVSKNGALIDPGKTNGWARRLILCYY